MQNSTTISVITSVAEMQKFSRLMQAEGKLIGFVPTMGALHQGHASLVERSVADGCITVTSIFVNPTQFGPNEDFNRYPRTLDADLEILAASGCTAAFVPAVEEMYPGGNATSVHIDGIATMIEGKQRPGHFNGVATIVTKLFNAVLPDIAYFGQKDYQQTLVVRSLVKDLMMPVTIRTVPTKREHDGLAMSSRNRYLSEAERSQAVVISQALRVGEALCQQLSSVEDVRVAMTDKLHESTGIVIEYVLVVDANSLEEVETLSQGSDIALLIAAKFGQTRLIDNAVIHL